MNAYLLYILDAFLIVAFILGLQVWKVISATARIIVIQLGLAIVIEASGFFISSILGQENLWLYNGYILAEFFLLLAGGYFLQPSVTNKNIVWALATMYLLLWVGNMVYVGGRLFVDKAFISGCIALTCFYLWQLISLLKKGNQDYTTLLLCYAILMYFCCSIPLFSFINYFLITDNALSGRLYSIGHYLNTIRYIITATGFGLLIRKTHSYKLR